MDTDKKKCCIRKVQLKEKVKRFTVDIHGEKKKSSEQETACAASRKREG